MIGPMNETTWEAAAEKYELAKLLMDWEEDEPVWVLAPGTTLDELDLEAANYVAEGDLTIRGDLYIDDECGWLVVLGDLTARNVLSGGTAQTIVRGNLTAEHAVHADYNDGYLEVGGTLRAKVVVAEHTVKAHGGIEGITIDFKGFAMPESFSPTIPQRLAVYSPKDVFVAEALNSQGYVDGNGLRERLLEGAPILVDGRV